MSRPDHARQPLRPTVPRNHPLRRLTHPKRRRLRRHPNIRRKREFKALVVRVPVDRCDNGKWQRRDGVGAAKAIQQGGSRMPGRCIRRNQQSRMRPCPGKSSCALARSLRLPIMSGNDQHIERAILPQCRAEFPHGGSDALINKILGRPVERGDKQATLRPKSYRVITTHVFTSRRSAPRNTIVTLV